MNHRCTSFLQPRPWVLLMPLLAAISPATGLTVETVFRDAGANYLQLIRNHYDKVLAAGVDQYGPGKTGLWLAAVDINKGGQPDSPDPAVKRTYRLIHAPRGSNLYWEQPAVAAAYNLSRLTGEAVGLLRIRNRGGAVGWMPTARGKPG